MRGKAEYSCPRQTRSLICLIRCAWLKRSTMNVARIFVEKIWLVTSWIYTSLRTDATTMRMKSQSKDSKRLRGSCLCWPVPLRWSWFHARHMTNYVRLTLELETSNEIARRPRQSHWFCDFTFLPPVVHWHEFWLVETISLTGLNFTVGNGFSTAIRTFLFLLMLTEMIFMSNTCIKFTPKL